ncbi:hypothetical protein [Caproicibacterium amylolyticum]|uniref:Uncharacterized protein n=1 Tax=Caproicibacterium amylolyticum TaxID=2766537 RepID=A0A7G9WJU6_9FIRM|nr:hypothetical protein [Caproicibacterium amylolyticum]QNO18958.1 hypothetical protein H6X83_04855 [Caproicibacterium amylolyticum]
MSETELTVQQETNQMVQEAQNVSISDNAQFESATDLLKRVKRTKKKVDEYWEPAISAANKTHKELTAKRKAMTDICDRAESIVKGKILTYQQEQDAKRRAAEAEAQKLAQAESERILAEAAEAEQSGNTIEAAIKMQQAETVSTFTPTVMVDKPKISGVSTRTKEVVAVTDDAKVPAYINGFAIRTVDTKAIMQLHKLNPSLQIPGIEFRKEQVLSVRA